MSEMIGEQTGGAEGVQSERRPDEIIAAELRTFGEQPTPYDDMIAAHFAASSPATTDTHWSEEALCYGIEEEMLYSGKGVISVETRIMCGLCNVAGACLASELKLLQEGKILQENINGYRAGLSSRRRMRDVIGVILRDGLSEELLQSIETQREREYTSARKTYKNRARK